MLSKLSTPGVFVNQPDRHGNEKSLPGALDYIIRIVKACGVRSWDEVAGRTVYFLWPTEEAWNTMPVGLQNLETEPGELFLFDDVNARVKKLQEIIKAAESDKSES